MRKSFGVSPDEANSYLNSISEIEQDVYERYIEETLTEDSLFWRIVYWFKSLFGK
jgi:hypothetical protein